MGGDTNGLFYGNISGLLKLFRKGLIVLKKKLFSFLAVFILLFTLLSTSAFAVYHVYFTTLAVSTTHTGEARNYNYKNVGYEYKNCTCSVSGAFLNAELQMRTLGIWYSKGTKSSYGVNGPANVVYSYLWADANTSGSSKDGRFKFEAFNNYSSPTVRQLIQTNDMMMFSNQ